MEFIIAYNPNDTENYFLTNQKTFDIEYSTLFTRGQTKEIKAHPEKYKFMPANQMFDYLSIRDKGNYSIKFRVVKICKRKKSIESIHSFN